MAEIRNTPERRKNTRIPFASTVMVQADSAVIECRARDLGVGGLLIYFDDHELPAIDSLVSVIFRLRDASETIELKGKIVRHDGSGNGVGLAFVEISDTVRQSLQSYIESHSED